MMFELSIPLALHDCDTGRWMGELPEFPRMRRLAGFSLIKIGRKQAMKFVVGVPFGVVAVNCRQ